MENWPIYLKNLTLDLIQIFTVTQISFEGALLTRIGVGVQEICVRNGDFLHLAAPITVGNAARFGTGGS